MGNRFTIKLNEYPLHVECEIEIKIINSRWNWYRNVEIAWYQMCNRCSIVTYINERGKASPTEKDFPVGWIKKRDVADSTVCVVLWFTRCCEQWKQCTDRHEDNDWFVEIVNLRQHQGNSDSGFFSSQTTDSTVFRLLYIFDS